MSQTPNPEIARQIAVLCPGLFPYWSPIFNKWLIVSDCPVFVPGITEYDPIAGKNYVVELILEDEKGQAIDLDNRVIAILAQTLKERDALAGPDGFSIDKLCAAKSREEKARILVARKKSAEGRAEFFKKLWKFEHTVTVN